MTQTRLANVIYGNQPIIAIEHAGELLDIPSLERRFAFDWTPAHFTDRAHEFRHRVFSLGMAGIDQLIESLGCSKGPRESVLNRKQVMFMPPTVDNPAIIEFSGPSDMDIPQFRWGSSRCLRGHESPLPIPSDEPSPQLSVQVAAIVLDELDGAGIEEAGRSIAGYAPLCLWTFPSRETISKGWGSFRLGQLGPCLVVGEQDPSLWNVTIRINGNPVEQAAAKPWRTPFAKLVAIASEAAKLLPGDIIASGPLANVPSDGHQNLHQNLRPGDAIDVTIENLGSLSGTLVGSPKTSRFLPV